MKNFLVTSFLRIFTWVYGGMVIAYGWNTHLVPSLELPIITFKIGMVIAALMALFAPTIPDSYGSHDAWGSIKPEYRVVTVLLYNLLGVFVLNVLLWLLTFI